MSDYDVIRDGKHEAIWAREFQPGMTVTQRLGIVDIDITHVIDRVHSEGERVYVLGHTLAGEPYADATWMHVPYVVVRPPEPTPEPEPALAPFLRLLDVMAGALVTRPDGQTLVSGASDDELDSITEGVNDLMRHVGDVNTARRVDRATSLWPGSHKRPIKDRPQA